MAFHAEVENYPTQCEQKSTYAKSRRSSSFLFTLHHLFKETSSTGCLKARASFKEKVGNRKDINMKIFWILC